MIRVGILALLSIAIVSAQDGENPLGADSQVVAAGLAAYNRNCTHCHGLAGTSGDQAPALAGKRRYNRSTDEGLFHAIKDGIPGTGMPSMGLSDDDSWSIVAYIRSLRASAADFPPDGNVANGALLFAGKAECDTCHKIDAVGGLLGPNLSNVGAELTVQRIVESLTVPKPHAPDGFVPVTVRATDGTVVRGILRNENNFSFQVLGDDERLHMFTADEISELGRSDVSMMPADYDERLSEEELTDLVAYLSRQTRASK